MQRCGKYLIIKVRWGASTYKEPQENMNTIRNHEIEMPEKNNDDDEE